jgi:hypothetical protein
MLMEQKIKRIRSATVGRRLVKEVGTHSALSTRQSLILKSTGEISDNLGRIQYNTLRMKNRRIPRKI